MHLKLPLVIPVENQVRELDPKLLLAVVAARRGFTVIIGSHREIDFRIASFPRSIYLNKSMTASNLNMFRIMRSLGHQVVAWDEEALVHLPVETYCSRRLNPEALGYISHLFAWGEDNALLWRGYPHMPKSTPIHVTGNPRSDLLRPEMHVFYKQETDHIRRRYGEFILVNTNFNHVNAFFPALNLFRAGEADSETPSFGKAAVGMTLAYANGLRKHKQAVFESFQHMLPKLERAFPNHAIVVRPHPTENQDIYRRIAASSRRIHVTNDGNVVPWLLTAKALIHNGCTTGVEAFVMRVPALSYRAAVDETYDLGFYRLPNLLSYQCFSFDEICVLLNKILNNQQGALAGESPFDLLHHHMAAIEGPLACERIIDILEDSSGVSIPSPPSVAQRLAGGISAYMRWLVKSLKSFRSGTHAPPEFHRHRYPGVTLAELRDRIKRFQSITNDDTPLSTDQLAHQIFRIRSRQTGRHLATPAER
jgi:surface carbohydrate biosynthesis protein